MILNHRQACEILCTFSSFWPPISQGFLAPTSRPTGSDHYALKTRIGHVWDRHQDHCDRLRHRFLHLDRNNQLRHRDPPSMMSPSLSVENALIGKTKQELLACTAVSSSKRAREEVTQQMFYQGASLLEESFPVSKGSLLQIHNGCLAHAQLREGRVDSVHYHAVPPSYAGHDHCDAIFEASLGDSPSGWRAEDS